MESSAVISPCGAYRYLLTRSWGEGATATFCMLNPSTADATQDDRTISKCVGFAKRWRCAGIRVVNLFAYRATQPERLREAADPVGPENDDHLLRAMAYAGRHPGSVFVCAWGTHGRLRDRGPRVKQFLTCGVDLMCLGTTKDGHPRHPLYVGYGDQLSVYVAGREATP